MRVVEVDPERWERWVTGFAERHQGVTTHPDRLVGGDGEVARVLPWADGSPTGEAGDQPPDRLGLILVRRGGYAVGWAQGAELVRHHCGTRYVQSRTAAGGWSQQRFARRRGNQADALVESVAGRVVDILGSARIEALVVGGDKALIRQTLAHGRIRAALPTLEEMPRRGLYDIPDPRLKVLQEALRCGRAIRVELIRP